MPDTPSPIRPATLRVNALGALHVFAAVRAPRAAAARGGRSARPMPTATCPPTGCRCAKRCPLRPLSPYGASKAALDLLAGSSGRTARASTSCACGLQPHRPGAAAATSSAPTSRASSSRSRAASARRASRSATSTWCAISATCATWSPPTSPSAERGAQRRGYNVCSGVGRIGAQRCSTTLSDDRRRAGARSTSAPERLRPTPFARARSAAPTRCAPPPAGSRARCARR